jgi:lambda family phage portal protein
MSWFQRTGDAIGRALMKAGARIGNPWFIPGAGDLLSSIERIYMQHYDAASSSRVRADWGYTTDTPYTQIRNDLKKMIARSRSSTDNNGLSEHIDKVFLSNVVGQGIRPEAAVVEPDGKPNEDANRILNEGWKRHNDQWDRSGKSTYYECQGLGFKTILNSGSVIRNMVDSRKGDYLPIAFQMIEPDRLNWNKDTFTTTHDNASPAAQTQFGVDLDEYGVPIQFHVSGVDRPISAQFMDIRFHRRRLEQYVGVPWKAPILKFLWDLDNLCEDQFVKSRIHAMIALWINKRDMPSMLKKRLNSDSQLEWEPARMMYSDNEPKIIEPKEKISESFDPLTRLIQRIISIGVGLSYQIVTKDLQGMNFASSRANILEDRRIFRMTQKWFTKEFCQRDWQTFVRWMFFSGKMAPLTLADYNKDSWRWSQAYWQPPGWDWVDPLKDAQAAIKLHGANMMTLQEHYANRGQNYRSQLRQIAEEKVYLRQLENEYGVEMLPVDIEALSATEEQIEETYRDGSYD